jgi:hypothetical protein
MSEPGFGEITGLGRNESSLNARYLFYDEIFLFLHNPIISPNPGSDIHLKFSTA